MSQNQQSLTIKAQNLNDIPRWPPRLNKTFRTSEGIQNFSKWSSTVRDKTTASCWQITIKWRNFGDS